MVQKHIIVSMIAPVAIAGILIIAMAAISSINQAFAVGEESNNTGNEATSHESKNTGTALSAQGEEQQSKNTGKKPTELTISASPMGGPAKTQEGNETHYVPVKFSGRLTSEGSGVAGVTILIDCDGNECVTADTDSGGHYSVVTDLRSEETHTIYATTGTIPNYEKSEAETTIKLP